MKQDIDRLTKDYFCNVFHSYYYLSETPTYYYNLWEQYLKYGESKKYPWDYRKYLQQKEADMFSAKCVHYFYCKMIGRQVQKKQERQLLIQFTF